MAKKSARILIVEDEFLIAANMQASLEDAGYECVGIADDLESAKRIGQQKPEIALVDINLFDGPTGPLIGAMLADKHDTSVIFVTANPRLLGVGVRGTLGVLTKPIDVRRMAQAIRFALARRRGDRAATPPTGFRLFGRPNIMAAA